MSLITDGQFEPLDKYLPTAAASGSALSLPETLVHGAVATVADIGTTYWNSLLPASYEVSTQDLLGRIDADALQVYNEHPEAIKAASFLGGLIAPVGLSMKAMNMARAGTKGFGWFSEAGQAARLTAVETAYASSSSGAITAEFTAAKWGAYRAMAANALADNIAAEIAIIGTLSAHPYMEDYTKDLKSNFLKSVAFGTVLQGGIGAIILNKQIKTAMASIEEVPYKIAKEQLVDPLVAAKQSEFSHAGDTLALYSQNIENLKGLLADDAITLTPFARARLERTVQEETAQLFVSLQKISKGELSDLLEKGDETFQRYMLGLVTQPEMAGVDKIAFAEVGAKGTGKTSGQLKESVSLWETVKKAVAGGREKEVVEKVDAIYTPLSGGSYIHKADAPYFLQAADLGATVESLEKGVNKAWGVIADSDWAWTVAGNHTARLDAEFQQAVLWASKYADTPEKFNKLVVSPDHLPLLKALHVQASKLREADPAVALSLRLTKEAPSYGARVQASLATRGGVAANYVDEMAGIAKNWKDYALYHPDKKAGFADKVNPGLAKTLHDWVHGSYGYLRSQAGQGTVDELYHQPQSKAFRDILRSKADAEGYVWLWRGMHNDPRGHMPIESYTILPEKAAEFGGGKADAVKLYRVKVDDVVAGVYDFGHGYKPEILVKGPTRDFAQVNRSNLFEIPEELLVPEVVATKTTQGETALLSSIDDLQKVLTEAQNAALQELKLKGYGIETMALKTGTPIETVEAWLNKDPAVMAGTGLIKYSSKEDIALALDFRNRALAISTSPNKLLQPEVFARLNSMSLDRTSEDLVEMYMRSSPSEFVQQTATELLSPEIKALTQNLYLELGSVVESRLKNTMFTSSNQSLEAMGPAGVIATVIGKRLITIKNSLKEKFEAPVSNLMGAVIKEGEASLIEANTALVVNASIKGRRIFKDGSFWVPSADVGLGDMRKLLGASSDEFQAFLRNNPSSFTKAKLGSQEFSIKSASVIELVEKLQLYGREMYELKNANLKALGKPELGDIGFWAPSFNPRNKSLAYVLDKIDGKVSMLYANDDQLLASSLQAYKESLVGKFGAGWKHHVEIVTKADQEAYNKIAGRHDSLYMQAADLTKQHGGSSASTLVSTDTSVFKDLLQGYQHHVSQGVEDVAEILMAPTMHHLQNLSKLSQGLYSPATKGIAEKLASKPVDLGQSFRNILLGRPLLSEHKTWADWQQRGQVVTDSLMRTVNDIFEPLVTPITGKLTGAKIRTEADWKEILKKQDEMGMIKPFDGLDQTLGLHRYLTEGKGGLAAPTSRAIALGNGLAATVLLRFMELAQPLVNMLSLPILTSAAVNRKMAGAFMGASLDESVKFSTAEAMYSGVRLMNSTQGKHIRKIFQDHGDLSMELRNVTELLEHSRSLDPGIQTQVEKGLEALSNQDSKLNWFVKAADKSEQMSREVAAFTGWHIAKTTYPGISDIGAYTFARNFMDEAIGNYTAAQRPAMFQGTFGVAMGLFQTYMLTLAQNMYRQVEHRDWRSLGKLLLTQSSIFGAQSLPGFHVVSEAIAENFSDQNFDLRTGTIRAVGDPVASMLLYGLPSSIGPGIATRGDIQPRVPNPFQVDSLALVNIAGQAYKSGERLASAAFSADGNTGKAMLEALSLQSISRPVARISELIAGQSITSRGDVVLKDSELYTMQGVISRVMATRPLEEIKAREVLHLRSVYGAADSEKRRNVTEKLKSYLRNGEPDAEAVDRLAAEYMRTGTSNGWRAAVREAIKQAGQSGNATTMDKLGTKSPLGLMLQQDLD